MVTREQTVCVFVYVSVDQQTMIIPRAKVQRGMPLDKRVST